MSGDILRRLSDREEPGTVTITKSVLCSVCNHRTPSDGYPSCSAFERIPVDILTNCHDHRKPYLGDGGVRFEERTLGAPI